MYAPSFIRSLEDESIDELIKHAVYLGALRRARLSGREEIETQELYGLLDQVVDGPEYPIILEFASQFVGKRRVINERAGIVER